MTDFDPATDVNAGAQRQLGGQSRTPWVVGVSGASGTPYARAVLGGLLAAGEPVDLVVSRAARLTILDETGLSFRDAHWSEDLAQWLGRDVGDTRFACVEPLICGQTPEPFCQTCEAYEICVAYTDGRLVCELRCSEHEDCATGCCMSPGSTADEWCVDAGFCP